VPLSAVRPIARLTSPIIATVLSGEALHPNTPRYRIAERLRNRLRKQHRISPPLKELESMITNRQALLKRTLNVELSAEGEDLGTWTASVQEHPLWLQTDIGPARASVAIDANAISPSLEASIRSVAPAPIDIHWIASATGSVERAVTDGIAMDGYKLDAAAGSLVAQGLQEQNESISINLTKRSGKIFYSENGEEHELTLISRGQSNFRGSTWARMANVRKAIREHVHNALIEPGATFSFNAALDPPVSTSRGWYMAKVIYNGTELRDSPGGGICQASTTTYRAIVHAGLPVLDRRSHSLYVSYYKQYGVGIDATVYPGTQDLVFMNDTPGPLILQAYDDENLDAIVNIYGIDDGRKVELDGPFFAASAPDMEVDDRTIRSNEIVWMQSIEKPGTDPVLNTIVSRYISLPRSLPLEFAQESAAEVALRGQ